MAESEALEQDEDLDDRIAAAFGRRRGDRPMTLMEALGSRLVEVTRAEVAMTTEVLGEVVAQVGRLQRRIDELGGRMAGLHDRLDQGVAAGLETERRVEALATDLQAAAAAIEPPEPVDLAPVLAAVEGVRASIPQPEPVDLAPVLAAVEGVRASIPQPEPVDLAPVLAAVEQSRAETAVIPHAIARALADATTDAPRKADVDRVASLMSDLGRDVDTIRARVNEVDRGVDAIRHEVVGSSEAMHAIGRVSEGVTAAVGAAADLERRLSTELADLGRRVDSLAATVRMAIAAQDATKLDRDRVAKAVGKRIDVMREIAAGVGEAVRNDRARRRERRTARTANYHRALTP